jgi:uncharacterized OB-fold protein
VKQLRATTAYEGPRCTACGTPVYYHHIFTSDRGESIYSWTHLYSAQSGGPKVDPTSEEFKKAKLEGQRRSHKVDGS